MTDDDVSEDTEFFGFKISSPQGADLRGQRSEVVADVGLLDDDARGVAIDPTSIGLHEPASGETAVAGAYTVNLNSRPTVTVTVTIGGSDPAVSLSGDTLTNNQLTFTTTNWNTAQTITVTPVKDDNAVGETVTLTHNLSGGDYAGIAADSVTVNLTDSDTRNVVLSKQSLTVTEEDATGDRYTVELATQPSDTVTVTISGHDGADLTLSGTTLTNNQLTFTTTNWNTAQTVTVKPGDDDNADNESETLAHTASGGDYINITKDLPVSITDDDTAAVVLSETDLTVTEGYAAGSTYTVKLTTQPSDTVIVTISGHDGTDLTLDKTSLTFTVDNWATAQTVTVKAGQDNDGAADTATLTHAASGGDYASITVGLPVTVTDDDTPGVVLSETGLTVTEGDAAGSSYTVKLATQPTGEVTVTVSGHAGTDLTLDKTTLTFTVDNWATAQTVTVTAEEDDDAVTDAGVTLTHTVSGGGYGSTTVPDVEVSITENDSAGIVISKDSLTVGEGDAAGSTYTVKLATQPSGSVSVAITGHAGTDLTLDKTTLTFTVDNWNTAQTVTVEAGQDNDAANDTAPLTHTASGGDYASVSNTLPVTVTDDDTPAIVLSETDLTVTEGDAAGSSYTVKLATQPTGEVTVTVSGHAGTDLTLDQTTLTFTVDNWATAQTVTVKAGQDNDGAADTATLTHAASGGDYASITVGLPVTVTDDDTAGVTLEPTTLSVVAGRSNEYTAALATEPTGDVTVTVSGHASTAVTLDKTTLTFTTDNWDTAQTVTVSATQNAATAKVTLAHTVAGADYGSVTAEPVIVSVVGVAGQQPTLQVGVSSSTQTLTVPEGGANSYTLVLGSRPTDDVTVGVTLPTGTDLTLDKTSLTFTMDNWDVAQTVVVTAAEDDDGVTDAGVTLTHTVSGGGYGSTTVPDVEVSITDDDSAAIVLSETDLTVTEGYSAGSSYTVKLATEPTGEVTVTVSGHAGTDLTLDKTTLTFTVDNWDTAQTVTVKAGQDNDGSADTATLTHTASGGDYANITVDLPVTVTDDDEPDVVLSETDLTVTEGDAAGSSYTVRLATEPSGSVSVAITGHAGTDLSLSGTTLSSNMLTFTVDNWDTAQTVTVKAGEDDDGANDTATLTHTASGGDYASITAALPVTVTDDDTAGVTIEPTALSVVADRSNEYTVRLATEPTGEVTVTVSGHAGTAVTLDKTTLTFAVDNWDTAQTVTVSATQNAATAKVTLAHGVSGADYGSVTAEPVVVSVVGVAGQQPTLQIGVSSSAQTLTVPEGGANSYTLVLGSRPTGDVTVGVTLPAGTDLTLDKTSLTFTMDNWDVAQTVAVTAAQDDDAVTDAGVTLTHTVSGGGYGSTTVPDVEVSITENDTAGVVLSETGLTVTEGYSAGSSYTVKLATEPTGEVTVTVSGHAGTDLTLSGTTLTNNMLTFTVDNWNTAQTVTVKAGQDADGSADTATLTHTASGGDYASVSNTLPVTVTDDDQTVTVQFGADAYTVSEGSTTTITVTLNADPQSTVVIPLVTTDQGGAVPADYSVPSSVMFNTGEMSKTFEFMAMADDASDTGESVMIGFGTTLPSRVTEGTPNEARVTINQMSTQFSLDCSLTTTVWCADLGFSDRVAENYGWLYMRYGHGWDPPSSLSDDDFRFRGVDYDVRSMELQPGTHPVMPNAWSRWQQGYSSFRIGIYWDYRWGAPSEEHYRDWVLHLDGLELPFKDALRHGGDFVWVGEEFQQVFNDWTPSTVTKIGIEEVAAADQDTNPLLPWAPMQVDAWPEGPDRLLIVWAKPA